ncbi:hypothetical protein [Candidatus Finniella inopinata]|uniref:Uncharacterized protein n=1 Tax=Candidatus Finniella inopinata TaxID=1696036 RepID=A0A4Q7DJG7_9PROT|nr:hypothetical protein [Candidatus Finniella inopinata]RZI46490.1 hypothetical protein EQU50_02580 [Candidatus Finniella inopinata]
MYNHLLRQFKNLFKVVLKYLVQKQPEHYWQLVVQNTFVIVTRIQDRHPFHQGEFLVNDEQFQPLNLILNTFPSLPLHIVLRDEGVHFFTSSLKVSKWWHRQTLLKQIKQGEFSKTSWIQTQFIPVTDRYCLAGVSPTPFLLALVSNLRSLSNPVIGIELWPVTFVNQVFKKLQNQVNIDDWLMVLHRQNSGSCKLVVCNHQAIIFDRIIQCNQKTKADNLSEEIESTIRYLNRYQYKSDDPLTIVQIGLKEILEFKKQPQIKVLELKDDCDSLPIVSPFQVHDLRSHHWAFLIPRNFMKIFIPLGLGLLLASGGFFLNTHFHQTNHRFMLKQQLVLKLPPQAFEDLQLSQLFQIYQSIQSPDPIPTLRQFGKILPAFAVATDLVWIAQDPKTSLAELTLNLVVDLQSLAKKSLVDSITESFRLAQEKIEKSLHKFNPHCQLSWEKLSDDGKGSLKLTYPQKKVTE